MLRKSFFIKFKTNPNVLVLCFLLFQVILEQITTRRNITELPLFQWVHCKAPWVVWFAVWIEVSAVIRVVDQGFVPVMGVRRLVGPRLTRSSTFCHVGCSSILPTTAWRQTFFETRRCTLNRINNTSHL